MTTLLIVSASIAPVNADLCNNIASHFTGCSNNNIINNNYNSNNINKNIYNNNNNNNNNNSTNNNRSNKMIAFLITAYYLIKQDKVATCLTLEALRTRNSYTNT